MYNDDKEEAKREFSKILVSMSPDVVETYSSDLRPNEDEIQLLRLKLEEAQCKNRVIEEEMLNLKSKVNILKSVFLPLCIS